MSAIANQVLVPLNWTSLTLVQFGTSGRDTFIAQSGPDSYDGLEGQDTMSYANFSVPILADLNRGVVRSTDGRDTLVNIESIKGSPNADFIAGADSFENSLFGRGGADTLKAGLMTTEVRGGAGGDRIVGSDASDNGLFGEHGSDVILGGRGDDWISGGFDDDFLYGGLGQDTLSGDEGNDRMRGNRGDDTMYGDAGDDVMFGGANNDSLFGDLGDDYLYGENGNDRLTAGDGTDHLTGGNGADVFVFLAGTSGTAIVKDFTPGTDGLFFYQYEGLDFAGLQAAMTDRPSGLRIDIGEINIFLIGVQSAEMTADDVLFGGF